MAQVADSKTIEVVDSNLFIGNTLIIGGEIQDFEPVGSTSRISKFPESLTVLSEVTVTFEAFITSAHDDYKEESNNYITIDGVVFVNGSVIPRVQEVSLAVNEKNLNVVDVKLKLLTDIIIRNLSSLTKIDEHAKTRIDIVKQLVKFEEVNK